MFFCVSFFLILWFFKYVSRSIILIRFCTGGYKNTSQLCFNFWLCITASLGLICRSHGIQRAFRLRHETYSKVNRITRYFARLLRPIPSAQHWACRVYYQILITFMLIFLENNPTTKTVGCKICIVVKIALELKWKISRKAFSTYCSWKKMCMRFWACPSQC
jgi:hypothetical protein